MGKKFKVLFIVVLALVFVASAAGILTAQDRYRRSRQAYSQAAENFTATVPPSSAPAASGAQSLPEQESPRPELPVYVDFEKLLAESPDVVGWLYCPDTVINYPVVQGTDNDFYLHHSYDGEEFNSGSIFVDASNTPGFADSNTVIYGHNMSDGSMFASLSNWSSQAFYNQHPLMWLLTPTENYRVVLVSGYTTSAYSDTYQIFQFPCLEWEEYLEQAKVQSNFTMEDPLDPQAHYVLLSTCAYEFDDARYVLHGRLEKIE